MRFDNVGTEKDDERAQRSTKEQHRQDDTICIMTMSSMYAILIDGWIDMYYICIIN